MNKPVIGAIATVAAFVGFSVFMCVGIWMDYPVVIDGVLQSGMLVTHLVGSTAMLAINIGFAVWIRRFLKESKNV